MSFIERVFLVSIIGGSTVVVVLVVLVQVSGSEAVWNGATRRIWSGV